MDNELSFQSLIDYFERRTAHVERVASNYRHGDAPQYPPFFVFLGADAMRGFEGIARNVLDLWPQYADSFRFVGADCEGDGLRYWSLGMDDAGASRAEVITERELANEFASLFARDDVFEKMTLAHLYFVLDTSSIKAEAIDEFDALVAAIPHLMDVLQLDESMARCSLTVLLNSDFARRVVAKQLRSRIADMSEHMRDWKCNSIFLLSNHRNDGVMLPSWDECYRIASLYIALSDCSDNTIVNQLFDDRVLTASYAIVRKPTRAIGQISLDLLLLGLNDYSGSANADLLQVADIEHRLGVTGEGTLSVIDDDAGQLIRMIVPSAAQLRYFPQREFFDYSDLSRYTYDSFDEACMGALSAYLEQKQRYQLMVDGTQQSAWARSYGALLRKNFSIDELIYLGDHLERVREVLEDSRRREIIPSVIEGASSKLRMALSQNPQVIDLFVRQVNAEAQRARGFRKIWHDLLDSLRSVRKVREEDSLIEYYSQRARTFLRAEGRRLGSEFATQATVEELRAFLNHVIDALIDSDSVFAAPFEAELMMRLNAVNDGADTFGWIYSNLTGNNLRTYLQVYFALDDPISKGVFIEDGTELGRRLRQTLPGGTYFYNTGNNRWAEAINLYAIDAGNINQ